MEEMQLDEYHQKETCIWENKQQVHSDKYNTEMNF